MFVFDIVHHITRFCVYDGQIKMVEHDGFTRITCGAKLIDDRGDLMLEYKKDANTTVELDVHYEEKMGLWYISQFTKDANGETISVVHLESDGTITIPGTSVVKEIGSY